MIIVVSSDGEVYKLRSAPSVFSNVY